MKILYTVVLGLVLTISGCASQHAEEKAFRERADHLLHFAADTYRVPRPTYSDPEKVYWPAAIARMSLYGEKDSAANAWIRQFSTKAPFHFILVGMARLMPLFPDAPAMQDHRLDYLRNVMDRTDSYNAWTCEGTENHISMSRTSGYLFAEIMEKYPREFPEAVLRKAEMKDWIRYFSHTIYRTGTGEFNASTYGVFNTIGWLNLYDFAVDNEVREMAKAVLDYYACELALHYTQGMTSGPESRGAPRELACHTETDCLSWLWFGDAPRPVDATFFGNDTYKPPLQAVHAATSRYRPPKEALFLARKRFSEPVWHENNKPAYLLDRPGYIRHFQYSDPDFTLGSACYPYGAFGSSAYKNVTWKLISRVDHAPGANPKMVTGGGMYYPDLTGSMRNPWHQVVQYRNVLIQLNRTPPDAAEIVKKIEAIYAEWRIRWEADFSERFSPDDEKILHVGNPVHFQGGGRCGNEGNGCYLFYPGDSPKIKGSSMLCIDLGKTYLAIRPVARDIPAEHGDGYLLDQGPAGQLTGLILEALPARNFSGFEEFATEYPARTKLDKSLSNTQNKIVYISYYQDTIDVNYAVSGTFSEPIYDWGYGPHAQHVIITSPPFMQPEWPEGQGHGRVPSWSVNGKSVDRRNRPAVYDGRYFSVKQAILTVSSERSTYRVDYSGELPRFSRQMTE